MYDILNRWTDAAIYHSADALDLSSAVEEAVANRASLDRASLDRASLDGANLDGARGLTEDQLRLANLAEIESDLIGVLSYASQEAQFLADALAAGKVNGSVYTGDCACLVGTIANARQCLYTKIHGLKPDSSRAAERWFLAIKEGDTPENSPIVAITHGWVVAFIERMRPAFGDGRAAG